MKDHNQDEGSTPIRICKVQLIKRSKAFLRVYSEIVEPNRTNRNWLTGVVSGVKHTPLMTSYPQHNQELSDTAVDGDIEEFAILTDYVSILII